MTPKKRRRPGGPSVLTESTRKAERKQTDTERSREKTAFRKMELIRNGIGLDVQP
jgi:hypothetical protein